MRDSFEQRTPGTFVRIDRDGDALRAYSASPIAARARPRTAILAMHLWGVDASMRAWAERFAAAGYATLVPDLYARFAAPDGDGVDDPSVFIPYARKLSAETVEADITAAVAWLHERYPVKPVIAGFCMGGVIAMRRATGNAHRFCAAAVWYGLSEDVRPDEIDIPLVASYGAQDHGIPLERIRSLEAGLRVRHDIRVYPGAGHAFCDAGRPAYCPTAAEDSWSRALAFFEVAAFDPE